jgi:hypothetical protein
MSGSLFGSRFGAASCSGIAACIAAVAMCGGCGGATEPSSDSSGVSAAAEALVQTPSERSLSPAFAEDGVPSKTSACTRYPQYSARKISALLQRSVTEHRGGTVDSHDACSFFGEGMRVRFVTQVLRSHASARNACRTLAGAGAEEVLGARSAAWIGSEGVYGVHERQCYLTQVFDNGRLQVDASLRVAQNVAWQQPW